MKRMIPADLWERYQAGETWEELAEDVIRNGRRDELVAQGIFKSGIKTGAKRINELYSEEPLRTISLENKYMGIQLNASQDITDTERASGPSQIKGVGA